MNSHTTFCMGGYITPLGVVSVCVRCRIKLSMNCLANKHILGMQVLW